METVKRSFRLVVVPALIVISAGIAVLPAHAAERPTITQFRPTSGTIGTSVLISGTGFTTVTAVRFDRAPAAFTVNSSTKIAAIVPRSASTGKISVITTSGAAASSAIFTVRPGLSLSAQEGQDGARVQVWGAGFGGSEIVTVSFDGRRASPRANRTGNFGPVSINVPAAAAPGTGWISAAGRSTRRSARARFTVSPNWSQFRSGPNLSGDDIAESVLGPSTVSGLRVKWSFRTGSGVYSSPAVVNGVVYEGSSDGNMYALNAATGARLWTFPTGDKAGSSPAVANGVVYAAGSTTGSLYALKASTGARLWSFSDGVLGGGLYPPTVANGVVYASTGSYRGVFALKASTGATLWNYVVPQGVGAASSAAVVNGVVYLVGGDGNVYALNAATGTKRWSFATGSAGSPSSPAVVNGVIYLIGGDGKVYALNAATGTKLWSFHVRQPGVSSCDASPAVANRVVYVGCNDMYALNAATGAQLWSFANADDTISSPAVANGVVYVGSVEGAIFALKAATGAELWSFSPGWEVDSSPAVASGMVYGASVGGTIYAFGLRAP